MLDEAKDYREKSKHDRPAVSHDKRSYTASLNWGHLVRSYEKEKITPASSRAVVDRPLKPSEIPVRYERAPTPLGLLTMQPWALHEPMNGLSCSQVTVPGSPVAVPAAGNGSILSARS